MAACTLAVATPDTGATPNTSGAFTPALNDLLVCFVVASNTVDSGPTLTSSLGGGFTFSLIASAASSSNTITTYLFVADQLVSSATSQTVTANFPNDAATGTIIWVTRVSGMSRVGSAAVRQTAKEDNISGGVSPNPTFASSVLTGNPTLGVAAGNDETPDVSAPTGWTEAAETSFTTPSCGANCVTRDSGFTGTAVTWNSTWTGGTFNSLIAELDASAAANNAPRARYHEMMRAA